MKTGRFHCLQGPSDSLWFDDTASLQEAFRSGLVSSDALVFDQSELRWRLLADHSVMRGLNAPPPRARRPARNSTKSPAASAEQDPLPARDPKRATTGVPQADRSVSFRWKPLALLAVVVGLVALVAIADNSDHASTPTRAAGAASSDASAGGGVDPPPRGSEALSGLVTNHGTAAVPGTPTTGSINLVFDASDARHGDIVIGQPLAGSGRAEFAYWSDTMIAVSNSVSGDSIVWLAARDGGLLAGSYLIFGGRFTGQGGRWWVSIEGSALSALSQHSPRPDSSIVQNVKRAVAAFEVFPLTMTKDSPR
jgi:hypothetical protein